MSTTILAAPPGPTSLRQAWLPLTALALAFFVEMVDNTVLTIALPTIARDLDAGPLALQWVTGAYALTFGGLLLTAGTIADRFGRRRVLLVGIAAFGAVSAFAMAVESAGQLIVLRAALGVAAAAMAPVTMSLVYRLFDTEALRMRAISVMVVVGMTGFALGPILAGTALAHLSWHWLLLVNVPIAVVAWCGVRVGIAPDRSEDLHGAPLDVPAAGLTMAALGLGAYVLTSGVERGWLAPVTVAMGLGALVAGVLFVLRERRAVFPMLDLALLRTPALRGAVLAQLGGSVAMMVSMFALTLHFQDAYGWSPVRAGFAMLPVVATMLLATPLAELAAGRLGHRVGCLLAVGVMSVAMIGLAVAIPHGYVPVVAAMVVLTAGLRVIMTVCAIALVDAMPANRTSVGIALNDTAQEVGTSVGAALVGTALATALGSTPAGAWTAATVSSFVHGEQVAFLLTAVLVGVVAGYGSSRLTDSRSTEEH